MKRLGRFIIRDLIYLTDPDILRKVPCDKIVDEISYDGNFIFIGESYQFDEVNEHGPIPTYELVADGEVYKFRKAQSIEEYEVKDD